MAKSAIHSHEQIIAAGEALEADSGLGAVQAWEVYQALGGRGNFGRVRTMWGGHVTARSPAPKGNRDALPEEVATAIESALAALGEVFRREFSGHVARLIADHVRQMQLAHTHHATELSKQRREAEFWRERAVAAESGEPEVAAADEPATKDKRRAGPTLPGGRGRVARPRLAASLRPGEGA